MEAAKKSLETLKCVNGSIPATEMKITSMQYPQRDSGANLKFSSRATLPLDGKNYIPSSSNNQKGNRKRGRPRKLRPEEGGNSNTHMECVSIKSLVVRKGDPSEVSKENSVAIKGPIICPVWRSEACLSSLFSETQILCSPLFSHLITGLVLLILDDLTWYTALVVYLTGCFATEKFGRLAGLAAHASKTASEEVFNLASCLPEELDLQIVPILDVWPGFFSITDPNIGMVDLNIFPENDRSQREFDYLLSCLLNEGLATKTMVNDIVLLVFTSHQLPYEYWRGGGKYYLWAVFSGKNAFFQGSQEANELLRDSTLSRNAATADDRDFFSNLDKPGDSGKDDEGVSDADKVAAKNIIEEKLPAERTSNEAIAEKNDRISGEADLRTWKEEGIKTANKKIASDQVLGKSLIIGGSTISPKSTAAKETIANSCLPQDLEKPSPQQRTNPSEEGREGGSENQPQPTLGFQRGGFSLERMDDRMRAFPTGGVGSETIGASVFQMFHSFDDVDSEGISSTHNSGMRVRQYSVKPSLISTLHAIIEKHGDIAQDCPQTSGEMLTHVLERVCQAVKDLGALPFHKLQSSFLKSLYSTISDAELLNLDVKWLRDRCDELLETVSGI